MLHAVHLQCGLAEGSLFFEVTPVPGEGSNHILDHIPWQNAIGTGSWSNISSMLQLGRDMYHCYTQLIGQTKYHGLMESQGE